MATSAKKKTKKVDMLQVMSNPRYRGKHIIAVAGKIFTAKTGDGAAQILAEVRKRYPQQTPAVTYIPEADVLIV
jgi:hypothetical protein